MTTDPFFQSQKINYVNSETEKITNAHHDPEVLTIDNITTIGQKKNH